MVSVSTIYVNLQQVNLCLCFGIMSKLEAIYRKKVGKDIDCRFSLEDHKIKVGHILQGVRLHSNREIQVVILSQNNFHFPPTKHQYHYN